MHGDENPARWNCFNINYQHYLVTPWDSTPGIKVSYPIDLLPHQIDSKWLTLKNNNLAFFAGSPYTDAFIKQHVDVKERLAKIGVDYSYVESWNSLLVHNAYVVSRFVPIPQLVEATWFLPSRFYKSMVRGCIPLSINPFIKTLLGDAAQACVFGADWDDVAEQLRVLRSQPERLDDMSRLAQYHGSRHTALHFLERILPPCPGQTLPSSTFWESQENIRNAWSLLWDVDRLEFQLKRYPNNRILLITLAYAYKAAGRASEAYQIWKMFCQLFPWDVGWVERIGKFVNRDESKPRAASISCFNYSSFQKSLPRNNMF